jgi:hypothetical protein
MISDRCVVDCSSIVCHLNTRGIFELATITIDYYCMDSCHHRRSPDPMAPCTVLYDVHHGDRSSFHDRVALSVSGERDVSVM